MIKRISFLLFLIISTGINLNLIAQEATPLANGTTSENFKITHGPYLQNMGETEVTITWTTNRKAISWLELAPDNESHFYQVERPKIFSTSSGLKNISLLHSVKLENLEPGTAYRYRIFSQEVISHEGHTVLYGEVDATKVYKAIAPKFRTNDPSKDAISFAVINDIHGRNEVMRNLLGQVEWEKTDLVLFNGDMISDLRNEDQIFTGFMDAAIDIFASEIPMYYARGNHETRGQYAAEFPKYFLGPNDELYYLFRQGPVCFIILDSGEDKPDSDIEYSGISAFDHYRAKQAQWLEEVLQSEEFLEAPYKVVISHIPPSDNWHGPKEVAEKFVPLLNEAGVDVMLSGHLHRTIKRMGEEGMHDFPVLINSNESIIIAKADAKGLKLEILDVDGKVTESLIIEN